MEAGTHASFAVGIPVDLFDSSSVSAVVFAIAEG
jgi:hypothetical protein